MGSVITLTFKQLGSADALYLGTERILPRIVLQDADAAQHFSSQLDSLIHLIHRDNAVETKRAGSAEG